MDDLPQVQAGSLRGKVLKRYAHAAALAASFLPCTRSASCSPHSGLGCGSPVTFAGLSPGERVLDLGSGAGFDCLAAGVEVGSTGRVVGVDMTPEMVRLACRHAADAGIPNVHFVQAEIERLPFPDAIFDVVISNCVINLSSGKEQALAEACRVLKPNGRLAIADIVALAPLDLETMRNLTLYTGCIAGAIRLDFLPRILRSAGFVSEKISIGEHSSSLLDAWAPELKLDRYVAAASITAAKPTGASASTCGGSRRRDNI